MAGDQMKKSIRRPVPDLGSYLGIDPGASGGICHILDDVMYALKMPVTERDIWDCLSSLPGGTRAVIEKVGGYISGEGFAAGGSAMFNFGMSYGGLRMALVAAGISFEEVTPQKWQKWMGLGTRSKTQSKTDWKNRLKSAAQQIYPREKIILATSDAILLATFCKRKHEGTLG